MMKSLNDYIKNISVENIPKRFATTAVPNTADDVNKTFENVEEIEDPKDYIDIEGAVDEGLLDPPKDDGKKKEKKEKEEPIIKKKDIKFTIWELPDKKVKWLNNNDEYLKIEYKYINQLEQIFIDFLLGFKEDSWRLWAGKIGSVSYDDDPYCSLDTEKFSEAVTNAIDKIVEIVNMVVDEPLNYIQYYKEPLEADKDDKKDDEGGDDKGGGGLL